MKTYWILDTRFVREVAELRLVVLGEHPRILGMDKFQPEERYIVFDCDVDVFGQEPERKEGWQGPYDSREEAETIAQRLNTTSD